MHLNVFQSQPFEALCSLCPVVNFYVLNLGVLGALAVKK